MKEPSRNSFVILIWLSLLALLLVAGVNRFENAFAHYGSPVQKGDEAQYMALGRSLTSLNGQFAAAHFSGEEAFRAVLYPTFFGLTTLAGPGRAPGRMRVLQAALGCFMVLMIFLIGRELHSPLCGLLAALFLTADPLQINAVSSLQVHSFQSFLMLLTAWALVRWGREANEKNSIWLGIAIGIGLTARSTLFLFPLILMAWVRFLPKAGRSKQAGALLLGATILPLLPWVGRNAIQLDEFVPFERYGAAVNIFTGSLGVVEGIGIKDAFMLVENIEPSLKGKDNDAHYKAMIRIAVSRTLKDPIGKLWSSLHRLIWLVSEHSGWRLALVILLIAAGLTLDRGPPGRLLALLGGYFLLIHLPMSVHHRYLVPLSPLVGLLAAMGGAAILARMKLGLAMSRMEFSSEDAGEWTNKAAWGITGTLYLASCFFLLTDVLSATPLRALLPPQPQTCEALNRQGLREFALGRSTQSLAIFDRAVGIDPDCASAYLNAGAVRAGEGMFLRALEDYTAAIGLLRNRPAAAADALSSRSFTLLSLERGKAAEADLRAALKIAPSDWERRAETVAHLKAIAAQK